METANPVAFAIKNMVRLALADGSVSSPNIEVAGVGSTFKPGTIGSAQMFESRETIIEINEFAESRLVFSIDFSAEGLILLGCFFDVGGGEAIHLSHERIRGLGQINDPSVEGAPFAFGSRLGALVENDPIDGLGACRVIEPDFASC